jgi:peptide/nickel transport system permease protein
VSAVPAAEPLAGSYAATTAGISPRLLRRLLRRPLTVACLIYLVLVVGIAILAPIVLPDVPHERAGDLLNVRQGPSWNHPLGTDSLGRDVLNRLLVGTRVTMFGVAEAMLVGFALAVPLGLAAGYLGGWFDRIVGWMTDLTLSMPGIAIVLIVLSVFPQNMLAGMVTIGVLSAPELARIIRSATLPVREELYIAAARVSGLSRPYIFAWHVLPRISGALIVLGSLFAAVALLVQTGLAYLGLIAPTQPSWGGMVGEGIQTIVLQPWLIWPPGIAMTLTVVVLGLLGDAVRDATAESWSTSPVRKHRMVRMRPGAQPPKGGASDALLSVQALTVAFPTSAGPINVVEDVSFEVRANETVGILGESGCGKTVTAMALLRLLPGAGEITAGRILFQGRDLTTLTESQLRSVRGKEIGLVSQEPMVSLNPVYQVGWQLALLVRIHHRVSRRAARARAIELLRRVQLPQPELVARRYPHELSGGMAQRVAIARALAGEPKLLIADEPTTALDVTVQAEILELLRELQSEREMAILLVTHDWGVIADICDRAIVMYAGQIVEQAPLIPIFREPLHPYTEALLASNPHHVRDSERLPTIPGNVPKPGAWPDGCHFHPRCSYATTGCREAPIMLERLASGRETRCIHHRQLLTAARSASGS